MSAALDLTEALIACKSVTPADGGCQELIAQRLQAIGFHTESIVSGPDDFRVSNLWAIKKGQLGDQGKVFVFAGHTDVVPTGPLEKWTNDPFTPTIREGRLYGRGAADMKTSLASFVVATEEFVTAHPKHSGSIAFLITSDEEGPGHDGTVILCERLKQDKQNLDYCIVGEPTSVNKLGDMIKNGRRGSLSGKLIVKGVQAHIAYPHLGKNPIHLAAGAIQKLSDMEWDKGNQFFQPTSFQISNIHAGTGANNVIPGELKIDFNFRFSTESTPEQLQEKVEKILQSENLDYEIDWHVGANPFLTGDGALANALRTAIQEEVHLETELSTTGGTSDARFISKICKEVVEFGPINATSHKIDECVNIDDVEPLKNIYRLTLEQLVA
ncbi:succinyl-diaminopimelate desuccinylase [Polynucleobacter paneuropaeus]|jgi:succinyl-diaminopimelate desuccinylase|uniref:succinyl-diaminopimelate desuccinylase n=1 Tax=Polynucleobacter paneuropaeus TaxID=2527775 RepID=UPI001BFD92E7|nr:succinyl-diaminopimelate desuccinylase [Polynucleobacter paneuropaeus]MBT8518596.1 succinyl-diaminopimelate desuccinylase [Polynucleobacter paneuropaeus]MBT8527937.1 succinyl-diaminopimelate desuccinylase [Polynucleobacter paneuropaeus]MBT8531125.1 succinyl-diaminopimelate desuccinylase [Polynucleobacter paneuropaeus]MBT8541295.1 succinyl-diaminopimelate desuccinylase [Polynucleobacter paneuropaeus]MBT8549624.1 succinyl-diaminopimelate desuccinylase [Polynucleobacter paneuropaeus]